MPEMKTKILNAAQNFQVILFAKRNKLTPVANIRVEGEGIGGVQ